MIFATLAVADSNTDRIMNRRAKVHPANEYAPFQKLFGSWFAEDDPKGLSSIPRLPVWSFQGVTDG